MEGESDETSIPMSTISPLPQLACTTRHVAELKPSPSNVESSDLEEATSERPLLHRVAFHRTVLAILDPVNQSQRPLKRHRPPSSTAHLEGRRLDSCVSELEQVLDKALRHLPLDSSFGKYYRTVEQICRYKHSDQLRLGDIVLAAITARFKSSYSSRIELAHTQGCLEMMAIYDEWMAIGDTLSRVFLYLDRVYLSPHLKKLNIRAHFLELFIGAIDVPTLERWHLQARREMGIISEATQQDYLNNQSLLVFVLQLPGIKLLALLDAVPAAAANFRTTYSADPHYLDKALSRILVELAYWTDCGYPKYFISQLRARLGWRLVFEEFGEVVRDALPTIFVPNPEECDTRAVRTVLRMCEDSQSKYLVDATAVFEYELECFLTLRFGLVLANNAVSSKALISDLLVHYSAMAAATRAVDSNFDYKLRQALAKAVNKSQHTRREVTIQLVRYCDSFLRHPLDDYIALQNGVVTVFKAISHKADFVLLYKRELSKRLLTRPATVDPHEQRLVEALANETGDDEAINGMRRMFDDLAVSHDKYNRLYPDSGAVVNFLVLKQDDWRVPPPQLALNVPPALRKLMDRFEADYTRQQPRFSHRHLDWSHWRLHQLVMEVIFDDGPWNVSGNMYQAALLNLLCNGDEITKTDIIRELQIDPTMADRLIAPLIEKKILNEAGDRIWFNFAYPLAGERKTIKLPMGRDVKAATILVLPDVPTNRNHLVECQCVIMRIMKAERAISITSLLSRCLDLFESMGRTVSVHDLKVQIDYLLSENDLRRNGESIIEYVLT